MFYYVKNIFKEIRKEAVIELKFTKPPNSLNGEQHQQTHIREKTISLE